MSNKKWEWYSNHSHHVRKKGLEPPRREAPDPKSGAATNYATSAVRIFRVGKDNILCGLRRLYFVITPIYKWITPIK